MASKNFTEKDREWFFEDNWKYVQSRWPDHFGKDMTPHYLCEFCGFISSNRSYFEVDHVVPKSQGGTRNKYQNARTTGKTWGKEPQVYPDLAAIMLEGQNAEILCVGCNQGKKDKYFIPDGKGYAYSRIDEDLNPDNRYYGPPKIAIGRYR